MRLQNYGTVLATIADNDKEEALPIRGFIILVLILKQQRYASFLKKHGIPTRVLKKISDGSNEILNSIRQGHISYVINTRKLDSMKQMSMVN